MNIKSNSNGTLNLLKVLKHADSTYKTGNNLPYNLFIAFEFNAAALRMISLVVSDVKERKFI